METEDDEAQITSILLLGCGGGEKGDCFPGEKVIPLFQSLVHAREVLCH